MRKYVLTLTPPKPRHPGDYRSAPLPSLYRDLPFDEVKAKDFEIKGHSFIFSGQFPSGRKNAENLIKERGGRLVESKHAGADYVVVGENPSKGWKFGNYGNKIDYAIELKRQGAPVRLIREALFLALVSPPKSPEELLDHVLTHVLVSNARSRVLLDNFTDGFTDGWVCCIPAAFQSALDIQQTIVTEGGEKQLVWTQGCNFSFSPGDTFYSDQEAYTLPWSEALQSMQFCLQVQASDADSVTFQVLVPNEAKTAVVRERTGIVKPSEFVRLLITGTCVGMGE